MKLYRVTWRAGDPFSDGSAVDQGFVACQIVVDHAEVVRVAAVRYAESIKANVVKPFVIAERGEIAVSKETILQLLCGKKTEDVFVAQAVVFDIDAANASPQTTVAPNPKRKAKEAK